MSLISFQLASKQFFPFPVFVAAPVDVVLLLTVEIIAADRTMDDLRGPEERPDPDNEEPQHKGGHCESHKEVHHGRQVDGQARQATHLKQQRIYI